MSNFKYSQKVIFILVAILCLTPLVSSPVALCSGILLVWVLGNPFPEFTRKSSQWLLQASVVGLGFGINAESAMRAGKDGIILTIISIVGTLIFGYVMGRWLRLEKITTYLISVGTAICGGSAIAAVSSVIRATEKQVSVSLGVIFILNSVALILFPFIGHYLNMTQHQFGLWSAIAIHDTSSVTGASGRFGAEALQIATTVKLARALWIIPVSIVSSLVFKTKGSTIKIPYFIGLFVVAVLLNSYLFPVASFSPYMISAAKAGLTLTLFFIGCGLSKEALKKVGLKPLIHGIALWAFIATMALLAVLKLA